MASQVKSTKQTRRNLHPYSYNFSKRLKKKEYSQRHSMMPPLPSFQNQRCCQKRRGESVNIIHHINKTKLKNDMILSIGADKAFDKVQHHFMIKSPYQSGSRGNIPQHNQSHLRQTHRKYNTQWRKAESLPTKIWNKTRMHTLIPIIQHSIGSPSHSNQTNKEIKGIQIGREVIKL